MSSEEESSQREEEEEEEITKEIERGNGIEKVEKRFEQLKEEYFANKFEELDKEKNDIESGDHDGYTKKIQEYNQEYLDKRIINERWKEYQESNIENVISSSSKQSNDQIQADIQSIKSNLLKLIKEKKTKLLNLKTNIQRDMQQSSAQPSKPNPLKRIKSEEKNDEPITAKRKIDPLCIRYTLRESEIYEDWILIQRSNPPDSPWNSHNQPLDQVRVEKGVLLYGDQSHTVGKQVCIESIYDTDTKWTGSLSLINPLEIQMLLSDGTRSRFSLSQFRNKKYNISLIEKKSQS